MGSKMQRVVVIAWLMLVAGCSAQDQDSGAQGACGQGHVLASGRVERDLASDHQYLGDTSLGDDSLAVIGLYSNPALGGDGASTLVAEQRLSPAPEPGFGFCITGAKADAADASLQYYMSVEIRQHAAKASVGDLISETLDVVKPPAQGVVLKVTGLEACNSPEAGGFCSEP